jgi:hypothetical protein
LLLIIVAFTFNQCEDDESATPKDNPTVELAAPTSPGHGQYRLGVESGNEVSIPITITSTNNLKSFQVTKTVNLAVDSSFATNGVMDLLTGTAGQTYEYTFLYRPSVNDVDQLVGFTFKAEDQGGSVTEGDLTLVVTLSPRDNLPRRRWHLKSVLHVNNKTTPNKEELKECEKDNSMVLFADGKITVDYGTDTGTGSCMFDGFNVYTGWELTEDNLQFIRTSYGIFSPTVTVIDTFAVKTLTVERFDIEQTVDLSAFGLRKDEKFLYVYEAGPL